MPQAEDLPEVLTPLVRCQATRLSHERFNADSNRLIRTLEKALAEADCGKRDWKALYTLFSDLWGRYSASSPKNRLIGQQILDHARNPSIPLERVAEEAQSFRLPIDLYGDWDKLEKLRDAFHDLQHFGFTQGEPAASVYQSAIQIKGRMLGLENEWIDEDGEPGWFYRGQRCAQWPTVPSINRELGDVRRTESEYLSRVSRIRGVVSALKSVDLAYDDLHALAIAQHYSNDLGVRTWLIDVTKSPYIALFFASDGGQDNDIGTITFIRRTSWLFWAEGAPDSIGRMRFVQPTGIPRIENQDAFFIEAPHPELFYQMSHFRFYFRQRSGVVFEDTSLNLPVLRERIYPQHDLILERLPRDWDTEGCVPLTWEPALNTLSEPDEAVFEDIVRPWLKNADYIQQHVIAAVEAVCRLHAAVTRRKATLPAISEPFIIFGALCNRF